MVKNIVIATIFFLFGWKNFGQHCTHTLQGTVIDFHDGTPLTDATVYIKNLNRFTTTDNKGKFSFSKICDGKIAIEIAHISCDDRRFTLNIKEDTSKVFYLEHHLEELDEVVFKTESKTNTTSIEQTIKEELISNFSDKSLGDALNTISGVSSLNTGNTIVKPMIHGLHSSRLLIINNNVRQFDQEWGEEHAPNFDLNSSNRIDIIKGANTLKYGSDAIAGLILISGKKYAVKDSLFGKTSLSVNSNGLGGNVNTEIIKTNASGFYGKLQTSYKRFGDFNAPNYNLTNTGLANFNASASFGYNSFEKGFEVFYSVVNNDFAILESSHIGNVNDLVSAINSPEPRIVRNFSYDVNVPKQTVLHHLGKIEAYKRFKGLGKLTVVYDFQINRRKEFDLGRGDRANRPEIDLRLFTTSLQPNFQIDFIENFKIDVGLLGRFQENNAVAGTRSRPLIPDYDKFEFASYAIGNYNFDNGINVNAGIRYDFSSINANKTYLLADWRNFNFDVLFPEFEGEINNTRINTNPQFTFNNVSASLGFSKQWENDFELLANYGLASRNPNPSELFSDGVHHSNARFEIGFLNIGQEIANKFNFSFVRNNENFGFAVSPYYKSINGFVQLIPTGITTTIKGAFPVWEYNQIDARIFGLDIDVNKKINNQFSYLSNLSLLQGDNVTEDIPLIHMPSTNFRNQIVYQNQQWNQLSIGLYQKTFLRQNRFPDYDFFTFNPSLQEQVFVGISKPPEAYTLFGLNTSVKFDAFKTGTLEFAFNIENVFNVSYRNYLNRFRFYADELGRNYNFKIKINY